MENLRAISAYSLVVTGVLFLATAAFGGPPSDPPQYDGKTEIALAGIVREVNDFHCEFGWRGTHLILESNRGDVLVHVGLASWLQKKRFLLLAGDRIEVTGWLRTADGTRFLIAKTISNRERTLKLRSKRGTPKWSGGRRGWSVGFGGRGGSTEIL